MDEVEKIRHRYARRSERSWSSLYDPLLPAVYMAEQERERALIRLLRSAGMAPIRDKRVLEIGCGGGRNLLQLIHLGFRPENLVGNELLHERVLLARHQLPEATQVLEGDAAALDLPPESFDIVYQVLVCSNILDAAFQHRLAGHMWSLVRPGGGILWYDYMYDNPRNTDVKGIPVQRIRALFPAGEVTALRITLAPPLSRRITRVHPSLYTIANALPFLRTHVLCWIKKS